MTTPPTVTHWHRPPFHLAAAPDGDHAVVWASLAPITATHPLHERFKAWFAHCANDADVVAAGEKLIKDAVWQRACRCDVV